MWTFLRTVPQQLTTIDQRLQEQNLLLRALIDVAAGRPYIVPGPTPVTGADPSYRASTPSLLSKHPPAPARPPATQTDVTVVTPAMRQQQAREREQDRQSHR